MPLVLVLGSPGSGKTALLAEWCHHQHRYAVAWLSVDGGDRDPVRFWQGFVAAVRTRVSGFASDCLDLLRLQPVVDHELLECLLDASTRLPGRVSVVLDDLHLAAPEVHEQVRFLLSRGLRNLQLVIGARVEPALGLHRLRMEHLAVEIHQADLRFNPDDAAKLVAGLGVRVSPSALERVVDRTEGWAAGLQLAALALGDAADPDEVVARLSGTTGVIADYLWGEVFAAQPPDVQRFLLDTCVVDELTPDLAATLSPDNPVTLLDIESANLLLRRVDPDGQVFRFHQLLTELLRFRLRAAGPAYEAELHLRAATWYERAGDPGAAFSHRWRAGHRTEALRAMHGTVLDVRYDSIPAMTALERALSDDDIRRAPGPAASFAAALLVNGLVVEAARLVKRIRSDLTGHVDLEVHQQLVAIQVIADFNLGDTRSAAAGAAELERGGVNSDWALLGLSTAAKARVWEEDKSVSTGGIRLLAPPHASPAQRAEVATATAQRFLARGQLNECSATLASHLAEMDVEQSSSMLADGVFVQVLLGNLLLERAEPDRAEPVLRSVREGCPPYRVAALVLASVALSRLWAADGRDDAALVAIADAYGLIRASPPRSGMLDHIRAQHVRVLLQRREIEQASTVLADVGSERRCRVLGAELCLAKGEADRGRDLLDDAEASAIRDRLELALLRLRLDQASGRDASAHALAAFELAYPERFLFPVVEAGVDALHAVQAVARRYPQSTTVEAIMRLRPTVIPRRLAGDGPDALTERERAVLRYMTTSMSYREVANDLHVSLNTVKTHVKSINRKLGGLSRGDTVAKARALQYL